MKKAAIIVFSCFVFAGLAQKKEKIEKSTEPEFLFKTSTFAASTSKSNSEHTATPTIIKITHTQLDSAVNIQDLIKAIPITCTVSYSNFTIARRSGPVMETPNHGNILNPSVRSQVRDCKWILIENIYSSCPKAHKANYKIIIE